MFYKQIQAFMKKHGIKQKTIAAKTGINQNTFSAILNGKRKLSAEELFLICDALDVTLEELRKEGV
ncbi:MAG: helix-turn-helix transcriptional regulator [Clostridia bacterium]|nr:helix-turn-helix transcriptional regulator [Clostridia bacterium]